MIYDEGMYFDDEVEEVFGKDVYEKDHLEDCDNWVEEGFMQGYVDAGRC